MITKAVKVSRRDVVRTAAAGAAALAALGSNFAWSQVSDEIKVGVIGAGGRGSGAAGNIIEAAEKLGMKARIVTVGDMFADRAKNLKEKHQLADDKIHTGFDAYKKVLESDCEFVILATPPGFRPIHFEAAVNAGKHVFTEKPIATDPTGVRRFLEAAKKADEKKLAVVAGTQRRHETNYTDTIKRIHDGAIGEILHMSVYWNGSGIWWNPRQPNQSDMEYQLRNWYHHVWLCGDQIVKQHIHNLDVANWVLNAHPISAYGSGGRQVRKEPGEIWDNFSIEYEYPSGARVMSMCRHWPGSDENISELALGTKGKANPGGWLEIKGDQRQGFKNNLTGYVQEHMDLIKSLKDGKPLNEGKQVAESTLTAIMGRMSAYTGKKVTWDFALNQSKLDLLPKDLRLDAKLPEPEIAEPGKTKLV